MELIQESTIEPKRMVDFIFDYPQKSQKAIIHPSGQFLTFEQLSHHIHLLSKSLVFYGVKPQDRVLVLMKPGLDFYALCFALMNVGATLVFIDPGMKKTSFRNCFLVSRCRYVIASSAFSLLILSFLFPFLRSVKKISLKALYRKSENPGDFDRYKYDESALVSLVFTSGGTGEPKGVLYTEKNFLAQRKLIEHVFQLKAGKDVDLSAFPLFSFISLSLGVTTLVAPLDVRRPAKASPRRLYETITTYQVTFVSGSPVIWGRLGLYCQSHQLKLPSLRAVAMFGAPVRLEWHEIFQQILSPKAEVLTPYGATECLPVSVIGSHDILKETKEQTLSGYGVCVGCPVPQTRILIAQWDGSSWAECSVGTVGEILVSGPQMTLGYEGIKDDQSKLWFQGLFWHRMGDMGYQDSLGRLWFCGRKAHRVVCENGLIYDSICAESGFLTHPDVAKAALISWHLKPAIVIERKDQRTHFSKKEKEHFFSQLLNLRNRGSKGIEIFFVHKSLPLDTRHNIKIDRLALGAFYSRVFKSFRALKSG